MSLNLGTMCRLCLSKEGTTYIFQDVIIQKAFVPLSKSITACVAVEVLEGDGLPTLICLQCLQQVEKFSIFREMCSNSDSTLRQYLRDLVSNNTADTNQKSVQTSDSSLYHVQGDLHQLETEKYKMFMQRSAVDVGQGSCTDSFQTTTGEDTLHNYLASECVSTQRIDCTKETGAVQNKHPLLSQRGDEARVNDETSDKLDLPFNSSDQVPNVNSNYVCQVCKKTFTKKVYLKRHEVVHSGRRPYSCKQCSSSFSRTGDLAKHLRTHPPQQPSTTTVTLTTEDNISTCQICSREFTKPYYLKQHEVVHYGANTSTFLCEQCGKPFQSGAALAQHKSVHAEDKKYSCAVCSKAFGRIGRLRDHVRLHDGNKQFLCNVCGKACGSKDGLTNHERTHSGDKPFSCALCDRRFTTSSNYRAHSKHHALGKSFACGHCDGSFFTKSGLERHERLHTGHRPFPCDLCDVAFYTKREMVRHRAYHLGNKRFACDRCNKSYFESQHLVIHRRSHSGERPFPCGQCEKSFSDGSKLKRHRQTHLHPRTHKT